MASERMTMEDIRNWITYNLSDQSKTWFSSPADPKKYKEHAHENIPHSDVNAARNIHQTFQHRIHYIPGNNAWHVWNGIFHEKIDGDLLAQWLCNSFLDVHKTALEKVKDHYFAEAQQLSGKDRIAKMKDYTGGMFKEHRAYRDRIHFNSGLTGLVNQIKHVFSVPDNFFNDDRQWLVLMNGVLDLYDLKANPPAPGDLNAVAARLLEHDASRPVWRAVNAELSPYKDSTRWRDYLATSLPDGELRKFLAVVTGAAFLAESKTKIIPVLKGRKDSGKTVFVDTLYLMAGGYGGQPDTSAIVRQSGPNFEQDQFRGLRFIGITEPNTDRKVDDSFLKKLTGGDILSTRNLHARSVEWRSQGILFISTNGDLKFNTNDHAIVQRFATVTFPYRFYPRGQIPEGKEDFVQDRTLDQDLLEEFDGILNWVINGMLVYLDEGIVIPASVELERERQVIEGNTDIAWLEEAVANYEASFVIEETANRSNKSDYVALSDAHMEYCSWFVENADGNPLGKQQFRKDLLEYLDVDLIKSGVHRVPRLVYKDRIQGEELAQKRPGF